MSIATLSGPVTGPSASAVGAVAPEPDRAKAFRAEARRRLSAPGSRLLATARRRIPAILGDAFLDRALRAILTVAGQRPRTTNGKLYSAVWLALGTDVRAVPATAFGKRPRHVSKRRADVWRTAKLAALIVARLVRAAETSGFLTREMIRRSDGHPGTYRTIQILSTRAPSASGCRPGANAISGSLADRWRTAQERPELVILRATLGEVARSAPRDHARQAEELLRLAGPRGRFRQSLGLTSTGRLFACGPSILGSKAVRACVGFAEAGWPDEGDLCALDSWARRDVDWKRPKEAARVLAAREWLQLHERGHRIGAISWFDLRACHLLLASVLSGDQETIGRWDGTDPLERIATLAWVRFGAPDRVSRKAVKSFLQVLLCGGGDRGRRRKVAERIPGAGPEEVERIEAALLRATESLFSPALRMVEWAGSLGAAFARAGRPIDFTTEAGFRVLRPTEREASLDIRDTERDEAGRHDSVVRMRLPVLGLRDVARARRQMQAAVLQSTEASLSALVVGQFAAIGCPVVTVHDCFGVPAGWAEHLESALWHGLDQVASARVAEGLAAQVRGAIPGAVIEPPPTSAGPLSTSALARSCLARA